MVQENDAVGDILFEPMSRQCAFAGLSRNDGSHTTLFEPTKQPAQLRSHNRFVREIAEESLDRIEHNSSGSDAGDTVVDADEKRSKIVVAAFQFPLPKLHVIDGQSLTRNQFLGIAAERSHVLHQLFCVFFEGDAQTWLVVLERSSRQIFHGQNSLSRSGTAANKSIAPGRKTSACDFVETIDSGRALGYKARLTIHSSKRGERRSGRNKKPYWPMLRSPASTCWVVFVEFSYRPEQFHQRFDQVLRFSSAGGNSLRRAVGFPFA